MAVSKLAHLALTTDVGTVDVTVHDGRTFYVRAATEDRGELDSAVAPLDAGRGELVSFRGHFRYQDGAATCEKPFVHRVDQQRGKDPTANMTERVTNAIAATLIAYAESPAGQAALTAAQQEINWKNADERTALAHELRRIVSHLDAEAAALRTGGRLTYRTRSLSNGFTEKVQRVVRADGAVMGICPEPPTIYGSSRYPGDQYVRSETETD